MNDLTQPNAPARKALALRALLLLTPLLWAPLRALEVGKISVAAEGGRETLKVETSGEAKPRLEQIAGRVVLAIPGGKRAMKTVKVGGGHPVKQIRFGAEGGDLRVVLDLSRAVKASLGPVDAKGFSVFLDKPSKAEAAAKAPVASVPAASDNAAAEASADAALDPAQAGYTYSIVDLALGGDDEHSELVVSANGPASYKPSVREKGKLIILSFRNSSLAFSGDLAKLKDNAVESVSAKQLSVGGEATVRVEVRLTQKLDYALQRDQNQLLLRLDRPQAEAKAPPSGDLDTLVSLDVQNADLVGVIKTLAEQAGFEYQFTQAILTLAPPISLVTAKIEKRPFREVLDTLLTQGSASYLRQGNTLFIGVDTEINAKRDRLPAITRSYAPKYLKAAQLTKLMKIQYARDPYTTSRLVAGLVEDPRDKNNLALNGTKEEVSEWLAVLTRFDAPEQGEASAGDDSGADSSAPKTQIFRLQYLDQGQFGLLDAAMKQLYPAGEDPPISYMDPGTRTLVVTTKLKYLRKIEKLLARLDVRPPQVNIEGRIVEVDQTVANQMGIDWSAASVAANPSSTGNFDTGLPTAFLSQLTYGTVTGGYSINARIQAMVDHNQADLVSAPNVTVNDNTQAHIATTDNIVIVSTTQTVTQGVISTNTINQQFPIPLTLDVLPKISGADRRVAMHIIFTLTTASGSSTSSGAPPPTSKQEATTDVNVTSGDTAVIGGLVRQNNLSTERKVPVLGDIPLLGMLFRFDTQSKDKKEVIIFITPSIVED
jgi:type II secretory pathway component HofQ